MKKRLTGYTFDASAQTVVHADFSDITLEGILMIINVTDQIIIYNFADTTKGGTLSTDTLTLEYDTTSMSDTDKLMILVEDGSATQPVSFTGSTDVATQTTLAAINTKLVTGTDIGDVTINNASGGSAVNIQDGGNTITVDGTVTAAQATAANLNMTEASAAAIKTAVETIDNAIAGTEMQVDVVASLPAGTNAIGKLAANSGVDIGDVDVTSVPTDPFGANADAASATGSISAKLKGIATALGVTALDLGSGTGGTRTLRTFQDTAQFVGGTGTDTSATQRVSLATNVALPAGTNAIGKLAANSGVDIGDVDVTSLPALAAGTNAIGKLLPPDIDVTTHTNYARKYYTNAGAVTDGIIWSPAAGKRWHVLWMYIQLSADATVTLEDDKAAGDDPVLKGEFKAGSGIIGPFPEKYPLASGEDAADLLITTTAGNVYVTAVGYEI